MSFQQGLSGLNAASKSLEAIGNNVANSNTVGYKSGQAQFADVYANSLSGSGYSQTGIGTKVTGVTQQFTQGNISTTSNALDIAINGNGFFRLSDGGAIAYSRNGQFELDRSGYIVNANGSRLTGYVVNAQGVLSTGSPAELHIDTADLAPRATTEITAVMNLDSRLPAPANSPFLASDPTTYNNATSVTVYDSRGVSHVIQTFYVKTNAGGWDVYASVDDAPIGAQAAVPSASTSPLTGTTAPDLTAGIAANTFAINGVSIPEVPAGSTPAQLATIIDNALSGIGVDAAIVGGVLQITTNPAGGSITIGMSGAALNTAAADANHDDLMAALGLDTSAIGTQEVTATVLGTLAFNTSGTLLNTAPISITPVNVNTGAATPFTIEMDYGGSTEYGSSYGVNALEQDGYASGRLAGFSASSDGTIVGRYTNGRTATLGQVLLASFANPNGLEPLGNNMWAETAASGLEQRNTPGSGNAGVLQSSAVEDSNVDLTAELVNMITAQRIYQANAQTIKTQDQVMQTLVNLR